MMRKALGLGIVLLLAVGTVGFSADKPEEPFVTFNPEVLAMGGAFIAASHGFNSLFYNPAGFAQPDGSFTLGSATVWLHSQPGPVFELAGDLLSKSLDENSITAKIVNLANDQVTSGGFGAGSSMGVGFVGGGLGLGAIAMVDSYLSGRTLMGISGYATATVGFVGGLALPFELLGIKFSVGADIRPMIRIHAPLKNMQALSLVNAILNDGDAWLVFQGLPAMHGWGIGLDAGAMASLGGLTFAVSVRDIMGTTFTYTETTAGGIYTSLSNRGEFPGGTVVSDKYYIPMDISAGIAFHPDLGGLKNFIDPMASVDCQDFIGVLNGGSPWKLLHAGAEVKLLSFFSARAGISQGYLTAGAGVKLLFLDANFAVFTRELGKLIGDKPSSGMSFELALRF
jgi:hypothetical protein